MKNKVLFCHYGKTGGTFIMNTIRRDLRQSGFEFFQHVGMPFYSEDNLKSIANLKLEKIFVHQQHLWISKHILDYYNERNFFTFMFLRHPVDLVCSLFFWGHRVLRETSKNPFGEHFDLSKMTLNDYFKFILDGNDSKLWIIPKWISSVNYVSEFSEENAIIFMDKYLGYQPNQNALARVNASGNRGYKFYLKQKTLSLNLVEDLFQHEETKKYSKYLKQGQPA